MARVVLRRQAPGDDDDDDSLFTRSLVRDNLSRISEGSNEAGSLASSGGYYSAVSGSHRSPNLQVKGPAGVDRAFLTAAGVMRLAPRPSSGDAARHPTGGAGTPPVAASLELCPGAANSRGSGSSDQEENDDLLRRTVKAFVESGVRGRRIEALRRDGKTQPVMFRLSRQVDAFEITPEGGRASHTVHLTEVASVYRGNDARAQSDLASSLPGLDAHCAVVDLRDGRCLTFRFPVAEAETFAQCMQIFVNEVQREASTQNS